MLKTEKPPQSSYLSDTREVLNSLTARYRFTFQENRLLKEIARDLEMWQEIPLGEELEVVHAYLSIEKARFQDRLAATFDVSDESRDCLVPAFMIQTLVENAVRHGIGPEIEGGEVRVSAHCCNGRLEIEVCDTGRGIDTDRPIKEGIGLTNTRSRLLTLYGKDHAFELRNQPGGGLRVVIAVPKRTGVATNGDDRQ